MSQTKLFVTGFALGIFMSLGTAWAFKQGHSKEDKSKQLLSQRYNRSLQALSDNSSRDPAATAELESQCEDIGWQKLTH